MFACGTAQRAGQGDATILGSTAISASTDARLLVTPESLGYSLGSNFGVGACEFW